MNSVSIRIKDGWLLREKASKHLHELWGKNTPLADDDWMDGKVKDYQESWSVEEATILESLSNLTGLRFRQNIVDVYIAPWFYAFSDPLVIGVTLDGNKFNDVLTHELLHRLLTDNTSLPDDADLLSRWGKLFGNKHDFNTLIHIPVHAIHKAIYLDVLKAPKRLERDMRDDEKYGDDPAYRASWQYVEDNDYKVIIKQLKEDYQS